MVQQINKTKAVWTEIAGDIFRYQTPSDYINLYTVSSTKASIAAGGKKNGNQSIKMGKLTTVTPS